MKRARLSIRQSRPATAALVILAACNGGNSETDSLPRELVLTQVDTLVTTASDLLGHPTDIALGDDGTVYVADARSNRVIVLEPGDGGTRTIGREGQGPGELSRPSALAAGDSGIAVFDAGNSRIEFFSSEGEYSGSNPAPPQSLASPVSLRGDGSLVVGSMGADSSLVLSFDPSGNLVRALGHPVVEPAMFDFASMKTRIAKGEVPDEFRNNVLAVQDENGGVWVAVQTDAKIQRYDAEGQLLWQVIIQDPQIQSAREDFFERTVETSGPAAIAPLRHFEDLAFGDGELWVLLVGADDEPAIILTLDGAGQESRRMTVPAALGATSISYDGTVGRLILGTGPDAQLLSVDVGL